MFFKKSERKKFSTCAILTIGALAAIGAASVTKCGKQVLSEMKCKVMNFFKKDSCTCPSEKSE